MDCKKVEAISNGERIALLKENGSYSFNDVQVIMYPNGEICVSSKSTPLEFIVVEFSEEFFGDSLVVGDTWERGYADLQWKKADISRNIPWYFAAYKDNKTLCMGVKTAPNSFCSWKCGNGKAILKIDIRNGSRSINLDGRILKACTVVFKEYNGDAYDALCDFCGVMCENPRIPGHPVYGGNDWYCNYGNNSFENIMLHTRRIVECSKGNKQRPYMVIDDGWEICHFDEGPGSCEENYNGGPWRYCNSNFKDMKKMADAIKSEGAIPGIWIRPLLTIEKIPDECILKRNNLKKVLDPSSEKALNLIREDIITLRNWGYKLIKHDFSAFDVFGKWGFEMSDNMFSSDVEFSDKTRTTAEIIKSFYNVIREAAGEDVLIMGCNTISHLSAGIFDIQRTGDDTSGIDWERTKKYGVNTLAFRMAQHNKFYCADADCVGITDKITWDKNKQWLDVVSKSGTALFVSIAENAYTDEIKNDIIKAFKKSALNVEASKPIDWLSNITPNIWESKFGTDEYEW